MKVIKASIDLATWSFEHTCVTCKSVIGIEAKDIRYTYGKINCYYHTCCLCNNRGYIGDVNVPEIVKADVLKSRRDKEYSSDW